MTGSVAIWRERHWLPPKQELSDHVWGVWEAMAIEERRKRSKVELTKCVVGMGSNYGVMNSEPRVYHQ